MEGISLIGCRENNLKNINITIPYSKIISFVGASGSGKSTVVFDTLYAEGKRRYMESLGVNESFFLGKLKKPNVDYINGLPPAIALEQSVTNRNPRSTVGTISELSYYLQVLFSTCSKTDEKIDLNLSMFNLNSPQGICFDCDGLGETLEFESTLIWPDQEKSLATGGLKLGGAKIGTTKYSFLESFIKQFGVTSDTPIKEYPNELKVALLYGQKKTKEFKVPYTGIINDSEHIYKTTKSFDVKETLESFMVKTKCETCNGTGYNSHVLNVLIDDKNIHDFMNMSIDELADFVNNYKFNDYRDEIFNGIKNNLLNILNMCIDLGVGYLSLSRKASTLSGGETQRLKIVSQLSSEISGVLYVLDEPSCGLHPSDIDKVLKSIKKLNNVGNKNTVCLVEHNKKLIKESDYVFELGPKAGVNGGYLVSEGTVDEIMNNPSSITGPYLKGETFASIPNYNKEFTSNDKISLHNVSANNLKNIDVDIPLNSMVTITGVSGSGKSSLVIDALYLSLYNNRNINLDKIDGREKIKKVILCDQSTIGKSSRSNPATYLDIYTNIRKLYASLPLAKERKYTESHFSFNVEVGRCEACKGEGVNKINMGFLPEMQVSCEVCNGTGFKDEILDIKYKDLSISDLLNLTITEAKDILSEENIISKLIAMEKVGLGYLKLGQPTSTLSGGESQRLKLAKEIASYTSKDTLIIFDEPTKGLHFEDVKVLLNVMKELVNNNASLIIVEHNLDVIASSDYIIDVGPTGGSNGGNIVGKGTPLEIANLNTLTGNSLKEYFDSIKK